MAAKQRRRELLESQSEARPVAGRVVRTNLLKPLRYAGVGLLLAVFALLLLAYLSGEKDPRVDFLRARPYVALFYGILLIIISSAVTAVLVLRNRRMIVGEDRLQLIGGLGRVIGQIPYDNIIDASMAADMGVEIILDKPRRSDTWWPGLGRSKGTLAIGIGLEADPTAVRLYLREAMRLYWEARGGRPWEPPLS